MLQISLQIRSWREKLLASRVLVSTLYKATKLLGANQDQARTTVAKPRLDQAPKSKESLPIISSVGLVALVIRVYDDAGNVIETHEHKGDFKGS